MGKIMRSRWMFKVAGLLAVACCGFHTLQAAPKPAVLFVTGAGAADGAHPPSAPLVRKLEA